MFKIYIIIIYYCKREEFIEQPARHFEVIEPLEHRMTIYTNTLCVHYDHRLQRNKII